jgi:hypothetical protein
VVYNSTPLIFLAKTSGLDQQEKLFKDLVKSGFRIREDILVEIFRELM